ncbi:MAG: CdaR family protein [Eubacteriales bacterium]|nr:CdaR family protein [Eubacteriales bacterium]
MIMKNLKNNNLGMKILSVLTAILIWLLVANINDPIRSERFSDIPVTIVNESALTDLGYAYEIVEGDKVSITVEGKNSVVSKLSASDFQAVADFSKLSEVDAVPIDVSARKYANQLELSIGTVNTMKIKKDAVVSSSVPVNIVMDGKAAKGYAVGNMTGTPNLVKVTGPENLLSKVKEIRAEVDIEGITHDVTTSAEPVLYDKNGKVIDSNQIKMDATSIDVYVRLWKTKNVKVELQESVAPAAGYEKVSFDYEPKTIEVAAPEDVLEELTSISLGRISLNNLTESYEEDIELTEERLPKGVILVDDAKDIKVKATIEKRTSRKLSFTAANVSIRGEKNKEVTFHDDNVYAIVIDGAESVIKDVKIEDFSPWIDISNLDAGEHAVRVHVKDVDGITVSDTGKVKISIR